jgi:hypothetical protein
MHEADLEKLSGMRLQLEVQVNTLESANINANTLDVMRRGASALKDIHNGLYAPLLPPSQKFPHMHILITLSEISSTLCLPFASPPHTLVWVFWGFLAGFFQ